MTRLQDIPAAEYDNYFKLYVGYNDPSLTIDEALSRAATEMTELYQTMSERQFAFSYAPGKWTPAQKLQHLIDAERVFAYRALRFARADATALPGFEQDDYVAAAPDREKADLLEEYRAVRNATRALFRSFGPEGLSRQGTSSGNTLSVRALPFVIAGHDLHHIKLLRERYLV